MLLAYIVYIRIASFALLRNFLKESLVNRLVNRLDHTLTGDQLLVAIMLI